MRMLNAGAKRQCFGYSRVSTTRQSEGDSLEMQRRSIELIAELEGCELVEVFSDAALSGGTPLASRPEGARLLSRVRRGDIIIATKLDRVSRDALDAASVLKTLKQRGVGLYLRDLGGDCTSSNVSGLIFGLLSNVAEFERSRIAERVSEAKRGQKAEGRFLGGGVPFGFKVLQDGGKAVLSADKTIHAEARRLKALGYSARAAAGALTGLGHRVSHKSLIRFWREIDQRASHSSSGTRSCTQTRVPQRQG